MMRFFYGTNPAHVSLIDSLENVKQQSFNLGQHTPWHAESADYGKQVANAIIAWSATDDSDKANASYTPPVGDGLWKATPPASSPASLPYWKNNRPIVANSQQGVTLPAPVPFSADPQSPFYAMVNQVYKTSQQQTDDQKAIALFWDDAPNGKYLSAFGHWISVLAQVAKEKNLSLIETAEAYAKTSIAMHEAIIATWKLKFTYNLVRPVTYIQQHMDNKWLPTIGTPPHPEYPAAHATLSSAAAYALTNALGGNISFTDHSYDDLGMTPRSYPTFEAAGAEAGLSRLYGGIHYQPSIDAGATVGKQVAKNMINSLQFKK
jgi:hypothetical protein